MKTQLFSSVDVPTLEKGIEPNDDYLSWLEMAGFDRVAQWQQGSGRRLDRTKQFFPQELTGFELDMWRQFLPTVRAPTSHDFDAPSPEAAQLIGLATQQECFDEIQIWTPEGNKLQNKLWQRRARRDRLRAQRKERYAEYRAARLERLRYVDPMAVGIIRDVNGTVRYFKIARWGEALKPFALVCAHVWTVQLAMFAWFVVLPLLLGLAIAGSGLLLKPVPSIPALSCYSAGGVLVLYRLVTLAYHRFTKIRPPKYAR